MVYLDLKSLINDAYAIFTSEYVKNEVVGADDEYARRNLYFVKCIYKVLLNQSGDEDLDLLTKEQIQDCIILFNKYSNSTVAIEYDET